MKSIFSSLWSKKSSSQVNEGNSSQPIVPSSPPRIGENDIVQDTEINTATTITTPTSKHRSSSKRKRSEARDSIVDTPIMAKPLENSSSQGTPPGAKRKRARKSSKTSLGKENREPSVNPNGAYGTSLRQSTEPDSSTPNTRRTPSKPAPDHFRPGHVSTQNTKRTGWFSPEETALLEAHKIDFCRSHSVDFEIFNQCVHASNKDKENLFKLRPEFGTHNEFWKGVWAIIPDRDRRSVLRFMRRHFQVGDGNRPWTNSEDNRLVRLHDKHGPKWSVISKEMERTQDDVVQRWKNKVEHRSTMITGLWNFAEMEELVRAVRKVRDILAQEGYTDIEDLYDMDEKHISWGAVSDALNNKRSRQQCADKWRKIKTKVFNYRQTGKRHATFYDVYEPDGHVWSKPDETGKSSKRAPKSQAVIKRQSSQSSDSDDASDDEEQELSAVDNQSTHEGQDQDEDTQDSDHPSSSDENEESQSERQIKRENESEEAESDESDENSMPSRSMSVQPKQNGTVDSNNETTSTPQSKHESSDEETNITRNPSTYMRVNEWAAVNAKPNNDIEEKTSRTRKRRKHKKHRKERE
ncbi:hypothetical protein BGW36DRAFT_430718 [Talaromyces proteolyticus]|uniref:Uncharacterized protein n=1 Tax=Talaromyces proteolyticus TaxID=1131652 RepID=A0AAD4KIF1_9EURO|nr:uncharacterized protein BGW36DRAFT_430718 [Talaromyces proteolyticus]KAH8692978.1 hypothetical protein BGW36DRAFT_430718 [Talaromyces proteolyticus]